MCKSVHCRLDLEVGDNRRQHFARPRILLRASSSIPESDQSIQNFRCLDRIVAGFLCRGDKFTHESVPMCTHILV